MKKLAITLIVILLISVQNYAQSCRGIPFQPTFGVIGNADTTGWVSFSNVGAATNPSSWNFRIPTGGANFAPFLSTQNDLPTQIVTLSSPCIFLDPIKTYELSFTFVGLTIGFTHALSIWLVTDNSADEILLKNFENLPFGSTELAVLITPEHFSQIAGTPDNYRIMFKSGNVSRIIPGAGVNHYNIENYLKNIVLNEAQNYSLQIVAMTGPLSRCNLNDQTLSFTIRNRGFETPATYNVCFRMSTDGTSFGSWLCQEFTDEIPFNEVVELRLTDRLQSFSSPLTTIEATVNFPGGTSNTLTEHIHLTTTQTVPYSISFDNPAAFRSWSVTSHGNLMPQVNTTSWHVPLEAGGAMSGEAIIVTTGAAANDRLVSGCIELVANTLYRISFTYSAFVNPNLRRPGSVLFSGDINLATSENLKLYVGRSNLPDDSDITLMDLRGFNNTDERTITTYFRPTASGIHFFGFLAYSDASSAGISISDFSIIEAPEPITVPVFMSFESYDNPEGWQTFSHNAIDSTITPANLQDRMRGWIESTTATDRAHGGAVGLRTLSAPQIIGVNPAPSAVTQLETNNNWLISPPIVMEAGRPIEIRYFRRAMNSGQEEILNIRVSEFLELQTLYEANTTTNDVFVFRDTTRSNVFAEQRVYFTPTRSGVHFVTFQYNSQNNRAGAQGMSLDEISIQDSARAQEINLSVTRLFVPPPACQLRDIGNNTILRLYIKNRTGDTIPAGSLVAWFEVTDPQGVVRTIRGSHNPSQGNFLRILPYGTASAELRTDMRAEGPWEVRAWFSGAIDQNQSDDTSAIVRTASTGTITGRYGMGFEPNENLSYWLNSQTGHHSRLWWNFINNPVVAHTGVGAAFIAPSQTFITAGSQVRQFITSPCLGLSPDTTYLISFFYRAVQDSNNLVGLSPVILNTYIGTSTSPYGPNLRDATSATSLNYRRRSFYFTPSTALAHYVIFEAVLPRWSTGIFLDNFVILDSISAHTPNLSLDRIWAVSSNKCDLSDDTLYVKLVNKGFLTYENPIFNIEFRGQTFRDTLHGLAIPTDTTMVIRLNTRLTHSTYGKTEVTISLDMEQNLSEQISLTTSSIKIAPIRPPYTIVFAEAEESERLAWNNLPTPFDNLIQSPTFEYWTFGPNGAFFENGTMRALPGILASGCFILEAGDTYVVTYEYRGTNVSNPENLHVQVERADGTIEGLFSDSDIRSSNFAENIVRFEASGVTGEQIERIRFFSNYNHQASGVYIRSFSIRPDDDVSIVYLDTENSLRIFPNPATTEVFIQSEKEISTLFIHDIRGQLIREIRVNNTEYHLNTSDFPSGMYLFTIMVGNERAIQRVIINHQP